MFELSKDEVYSHTDGDAWKALLSVNANETSVSKPPWGDRCCGFPCLRPTLLPISSCIWEMYTSPCAKCRCVIDLNLEEFVSVLRLGIDRHVKKLMRGGLRLAFLPRLEQFALKYVPPPPWWQIEKSVKNSQHPRGYMDEPNARSHLHSLTSRGRTMPSCLYNIEGTCCQTLQLRAVYHHTVVAQQHDQLLGYRPEEVGLMEKCCECSQGSKVTPA